MLIDQPSRKRRFDAAAGDGDALAALVREHGRGVRQVLAGHVDRWSAVEHLEVAVWSEVRKDLGTTGDVAELVQATARTAALHYLERADREAIQERDVLRRLTVQVALDDLRGQPPAIPPAEEVRQRLPHLPDEQRTLLDLYYAHAVALQHLALQRNVQFADLAHDCCAARAACDWRAGVQTPAGDRLLPSLTEDLLSDTLDPDSRALLATSVTQDLGRSVRLERQVRLHLVLRAVLGPFADREVQAVVAAVTGKTDPARTQTASATGSGRTRMRPSETIRSPISSRRPASHAGGAGRQPWLIPALIGGALLVLVVVLLPGRGPAQSKGSLTADDLASLKDSGLSAPAPTATAEPAPPPPTPGASALRPQQLVATTPSPVEKPAAPAPATKPPVVTPVGPVPAAASPLESITLINADTDKPIPGYESLSQDTTIRLSQLPTRRINFEFRAPPDIKSLTFTIPGCSLRKDGVEKGRPFSLSNTGPDFKPWTPAPGNYTLTVSACSDGEGKKVVRRTTWRIRFSE